MRDFSNATIMVTGGAGFIGSNFIYHISKLWPNAKIINFDKLTYAGNIQNLDKMEGNKNYHFILGDIASREDVEKVFETFNIDCVVNFAAESHVDRSIHDVSPFIQTNTQGTANLMSVADAKWTNKENKFYLQVSTDEVYGSLGPEGKFDQHSPLDPQNPYAASKAAADMMVMAFVNTHKMPAAITRCTNNYGPMQFPEKLIPITIINILNKREIPIYGDGKQIRDWIYVEDHCEGIVATMQKGKTGRAYNFGGEAETYNIDLVNTLCETMDEIGAGKDSKKLITYVTDRPGHDRRYAIDITEAKNELGWEPKHNMKDAMKATVNWYLENKRWWQNLLNREYEDYYAKQYGDR